MLAAWMIAAVLFQPQAPAVQPQAPAAAPGAPVQAAKPTALAKLKGEAEKLKAIVKAGSGLAFLRAVETLKDPGTRTVYRNKSTNQAFSAEQYEKLPMAKQGEMGPRECPPDYYFYTGYGSPLVYVRVVELMAEFGVTDLSKKHILDFGYGTIGHLRLMRELGAVVEGVDVDPVLAALYSRPEDLDEPAKDAGKPEAPKPELTGGDAPLGKAFAGDRAIRLHTGHWPADAGIEVQVLDRGAYDVITSKNTLKAGYIHPAPPPGKKVDERQLVRLGVSDAMYLKAVHDALKPGGLFIIYNISPAQSAAEDLSKPYLPFADGKCPFTREQLEAAGFEAAAFDRDDQPWVLDCWKALGYDQGKGREALAKEIFAWCTVAKRK